MDKQKVYSVSISKDLKCIGEGWDSEIWFEIKVGAYDNLNDTQMRNENKKAAATGSYTNCRIDYSP